MYQVKTLPAFNDNYIWLLINNQKQCVVVDPGDASPVLEAIATYDLTLTDILVTHHHKDHVGGIASLLAKFPSTNIYGPSTARFPMVTHPCQSGQKITLKAGMHFNVMELTGHTIDHIGFYDESNAFVGDTMFSAGCGRLFEGSAEQMKSALERIVLLGEEINIYCAHEYTLANLEFASAVEPDNQELTRYLSKVQELRAQNKPSIPTTVATQISVNPFLRSHVNAIKQNVKQHFDLSELPDTQNCFRLLRQWKDNF